MDMMIRNETEKDFREVEEVTREAFYAEALYRVAVTVL